MRSKGWQSKKSQKRRLQFKKQKKSKHSLFLLHLRRRQKIPLPSISPL